MKFKRKILVFITGGPASGKDTQAKLLAKELKAKKVTISDVIKKFFKNYSREVLRINKRVIDIRKEQENLSQGKLVSFYLVSWLVENLIRNNLPLKKNLVIVGGPRSLLEAKTYLGLVKKEKIDSVFIYLNVGEQEIYKRTAERRRNDDLIEVVKTRIKYFKKFTLPAINYLKKKGELIEIDGERTVKEISKDILNKIKEKLV